MNRRGATTTLGTILVMVIVVLSILLVAVVALQTFAPGPGAPATKVDVGYEDGHVAITSRSGEAVPRTDLSVIVAVNGTTETTALDEAAVAVGDDDRELSPGETLTLPAPEPPSAASPMTVTVVHTPSDTIVERVILGPPTTT